MDWQSLLEKYRSQLGWLALAGVALLAVKKDDRWPPEIDTGRKADSDDIDNQPARKTRWNYEGKQEPKFYPATIKIDIGATDLARVKIEPSFHFKQNWKKRNKYVENDSLGLIGRFPSMALAGIMMTSDTAVASHQQRHKGSVLEDFEKLEGRVKYTGTRMMRPRMAGGSGRLGMPFHEALILFEVYRFDNGSFLMDLINVVPREARGKFRSQYTEMNHSSWPDNARIDPISADLTEGQRPTYGLWLHEPLTAANALSSSSIEWLEGDHEQGGNFSLKQWKKSSKAAGIKPKSSRPPVLEVDPAWKNMDPSKRKSTWDNMCRACPALLSSAQGEAIAAIKGKMRKRENRIKAQQTLLAWGQPQVQKYVDQNCWI